ncbi:DUF4430 domain-containing protein [Aerococcaceae bacterium DSM 109653]|uniref:DUF4430 domain-containing protein n=2 Tax=Fundicoccus ignavus TaxID=2664442 RepID=A0A6I2GAR2_9LACT|nr:DUF4430 domain-containing protein [Fundicoccus ignavus]MRI84296.1 DUF4430 domain-containing protein [Fundicoccus ignavus]MRJ46985.1 DUF4430 domain-containing protein [Fundicoccus ignavus]
MMKKWLLLLSASFILTACGEQTTETSTDTTSQETSSVVEDASTEDVVTVEVTISVTEDGELIENGEQVVEVEEGALLLDVMKENFEIEETDTFINAINGVEQDATANKWWLFDVNGEMAQKGAAETELKAGDLIEWKLEAYE